MYRSLILTITLTILSSVAYGKNCDANQTKACMDFCAKTSAYSGVVCSGPASTPFCNGYLKDEASRTKCTPEVGKACSVLTTKLAGACTCINAGKKECSAP